MYKAIVTKIERIEPIPDADNIVKAIVCGMQVVTSKNTSMEDLIIFFPTDGAFSHEFAYQNNLYRENKGENKIAGKYGYLDSNRRIKNLKLKSVLSEGIIMPLDSVAWTGVDLSTLTEGITFNELNGHIIAEKYETEATRNSSRANKTKQIKANRSPMFAKHYDTENLNYFLHILEPGRHIVVTEKLHGTSGRTGNVLVKQSLPWYASLWNRWMGWTNFEFEPGEKWEILSGTRNTVLGNQTEGDGYHSGNFRQKIHNMFQSIGIPQGYIVYYEIVGYESPNAKPIMARHSPKDLSRDFKKKYGASITYSYGCEPGEYSVYVYRVTKVDEAGEHQDLSWKDTKSFCEQHGLSVVPEILEETITEETINNIRLCVNGPSTVDLRHPREGVCVRLEDGPRAYKAYKLKSPEFQYMEGVLKDTPEYIDTEEAA